METKYTVSFMLEEIDFLCHGDGSIPRFECKERLARLKKFDPEDLELIMELCDEAYTQGKNL